MSEWISVKKELPDKNVTVLTLDNFGHVKDRCLKDCGYIELFAPDGVLPGRHVTHWMPLPEPPEVDHDHD